MSLMIFYKKIGEETRRAEEYAHDFERRTARSFEYIDPESARGADLARLYDVVEYPTIVATAVDGQVRASWRGFPLPTIDEVSYYV